MEKNKLYYGDNLEVLRQHVKDESVDLIYLDPPFNSRQDYNVLFAEKDGTRSSSQIMAFEDTWEWNVDAERAYEEIVERGGRVSEAMRAFRTFLGHSDMMAYLAMMAPRLIELHRVLKVTGSIYLHCDPTASHYLKMLMDASLGRSNSETRSSGSEAAAHSDTKQGRQRYGHIHDILLFYTQGRRVNMECALRSIMPNVRCKDYRLHRGGDRTPLSTRRPHGRRAETANRNPGTKHARIHHALGADWMYDQRVRNGCEIDRQGARLVARKTGQWLTSIEALSRRKPGVAMQRYLD